MSRPGSLAEWWGLLARVSRLELVMVSEPTAVGWRGRGIGAVRVTQIDTHTLIFRERGVWRPGAGGRLTFRNLYRWQRDDAGGRLRLARRLAGEPEPVHLVDLVPARENALDCAEVFVCGDDRYRARLERVGASLTLHWRVEGRTKRGDLTQIYG